MPRIKEYQSQVSAEQPIPGRLAEAEDFGGTGLSHVGAAVESAGRSLAQIQQTIQLNKSRQEVTDADMALSQASADLTIELHKRGRDWKPGDGDMAETFQNAVKARFDSINIGENGGNRFETNQGQQHFERKAAHLASQFVVESAKEQARLSGVQAVADHRQMVDTNANMLQQQPAFFDSTREDMIATINNPDGVYARIPATERANMIRQGEEALAVAAVQGQIRQAPLYAREQLQKGWMNTYIPNDRMPGLIEHADTAVHALEVDGDRAHKEAEWARIETARKIEDTLFTKMAAHDANPSKNKPLTAQDLVDSGLGQFNPEKYGSMIGVLHTRSREKLEPIATDPGVMRGLFERVHLPVGDPRKITDETVFNDAYGKRGKLSFDDLNRLRKELADARTPEGEKLGVEKTQFLAGMKTSITKSNPLLGSFDPYGDANLYRFQYMVDRKIEQYRKDGKDPHDLLDPSHHDYLGKPERLRPFQKTMTESIHDMAEQMRRQSAPGTPPAGRKSLNEIFSGVPETLPEDQMRKPGETYQQWRDRVIVPGAAKQ